MNAERHAAIEWREACGVRSGLPALSTTRRGQQREQAPRTPNASRGRTCCKILAVANTLRRMKPRICVTIFWGVILLTGPSGVRAETAFEQDCAKVAARKGKDGE